MHFILKVDMHDIASKRVVHEVVQWKLSGATGKEERREGGGNHGWNIH